HHRAQLAAPLRQPLHPPPQHGAHRRPTPPVGPRGLDEQPPHATVARLRERPAALLLARAPLARLRIQEDEPDNAAAPSPRSEEHQVKHMDVAAASSAASTDPVPARGPVLPGVECRARDSPFDPARWQGGSNPAVDRWLEWRKRLRLIGRHRLFCRLRGEPLWASYVRDSASGSWPTRASKRASPPPLRARLSGPASARRGGSIDEIQQLLENARRIRQASISSTSRRRRSPRRRSRRSLWPCNPRGPGARVEQPRDCSLVGAQGLPRRRDSRVENGLVDAAVAN